MQLAQKKSFCRRMPFTHPRRYPVCYGQAWQSRKFLPAPGESRAAGSRKIYENAPDSAFSSYRLETE